MSDLAPKDQAVLTITHGHTTPPPHPPDTLGELIAAVNAADHGLVLRLAAISSDMRECGWCDPTGPRGVAIATIEWTNRLNRPVSRGACALCVSTGLHEATSDGRDVTVRAALGSVA